MELGLLVRLIAVADSTPEFEHLDQKKIGRPTLFIWDLNLVAERNLNPQDIAHYATR